MNLPELLRDEYGLCEESAGRVTKWVSTLSDRERYIFWHKAFKLSNRSIAARMGMSHTYVSSTIRSWSSLKEIID